MKQTPLMMFLESFNEVEYFTITKLPLEAKIDSYISSLVIDEDEIFCKWVIFQN